MPVLGEFPRDLMTLAQWDALELDPTRRWELSEGIPIMSPRPHPMHQRIAHRLTRLLNDALPEDLEALPEVEVTTDPSFPPSVRTPDVVVVPRRVTAQQSSRIAAVDVVLAVEIVSPGSRGTDYVMKMHEYATAGIPHYWIIDATAEPGEQFIAFVLDENGYRKLDTHAGEGVRLTAPFPMEFAIRDLTD